MTNDAFIDVFIMRLDSATIAIVEIQLRPIADMGAQLAIRLRSMRTSSDIFALWTDRHGYVMYKGDIKRDIKQKEHDL